MESQLLYLTKKRCMLYKVDYCQITEFMTEFCPYIKERKEYRLNIPALRKIDMSSPLFGLR